MPYILFPSLKPKQMGAAHHMCWELSVANPKAEYMEKKPKHILATPIEEECAQTFTTIVELMLGLGLSIL